MELGAFTVFLYALKAREWLFELLEEVCGARLTSTYLRIGGVAYDLPPELRRQAARHPRADAGGPVGHLEAARPQPDLPRPDGRHRDHHPGRRAGLRDHRARWARSTGLAYDVRKDHPYLVYDRFDFDVPVGSVGDNFDRYAVRVEEIAPVDRASSTRR